MSFKKCKIVMLPHNNIVTIITKYHNGDPNIKGKLSTNNDICQYHTNQHLYILSDDEIKEGDWCYVKEDSPYPPTIEKVVSIKDNFIISNLGSSYINDSKKIIATTDKSLKIPRKDTHLNAVWKLDGALLPQPSQSFIEKYIEEYNKGNQIEEVMVEYEEDLIKVYDNLGGHPGGHWELNPETNGIKLFVKCDNTITIKNIKESWNREELKKILLDYSEAVMEYRESFSDNPQDPLPDLPNMEDYTDNWVKENL